MTHTVLRIAMFAILLCVSHSTQAQDLDEHLHIFAPLVGQTWVGGYIDHDLEIILHFEPMLQGQAVGYRRVVAELNYSAETRFYWDPRSATIAFHGLNSRGMVENGTVAREDTKVILRGVTQWPDHDVEFKTILEILPDGRLRDTFLRRENGAWVPGHVQEFVVQQNRRGEEFDG